MVKIIVRFAYDVPVHLKAIAEIHYTDNLDVCMCVGGLLCMNKFSLPNSRDSNKEKLESRNSLQGHI